MQGLILTFARLQGEYLFLALNLCGLFILSREICQIIGCIELLAIFED